MNYTELRKTYADEWRIWYEMCYKCEHNQEYYVEISVCDEWKGQQGFVNFVDDMGERPGSGYYLSRKNKMGDWEPNNVEWVEGKAKASIGKKLNREPEFYEYKQVALQNGISYITYFMRVKRGWTLKDAATLPQSQVPYKKRII